LFVLFLSAICFLCCFFTVASPFLLSSREQFPAIAWAAPSFVFSHNMSETDNGQTVVAAVTSQVKLCAYDEEEKAIWFRLIKT
jgi:hypothetical protein